MGKEVAPGPLGGTHLRAEDGHTRHTPWAHPMEGALGWLGKIRAGKVLVHGRGHSGEGWMHPWSPGGEAGSADGDRVRLGHAGCPAAPCLGG